MRNTIISIKLLLPLLIISCGVSLWAILSQSVRLDEAQSLWIATKPVDTIIAITSEDVHVPLYSFLLHFWLQIFGASLSAARVLSFLFFLLTLPVLYLFVKESSSKAVALLSVTLFALSPFIMWYSGEARMYTLFTLVTSLSHLFFLRMIRTDGQEGKLGYFISLLLGLYTHYFFVFLIATQALYVAWTMFKNYQEKVPQGFMKKTYGIIALASLCFVPWIWLLFSTGMAANTQPLIPPPTSFNVIQTYVNFIFGFQTQGIQSILVSLWPIAIMSLFFVFTKRKKVTTTGMTYLVLASFIPIVLVYFVSFFQPIFLSRYLIVVTPTLFFLFAWLLLQHSRKVSNLLIASVLLFMLGLMIFQTTSAATPVRENYEGVSAYLEEEATPHDIILISAPFTLYPIEYTYQGTTRLSTIPEWDRYEYGPIPTFSLEELDNRIQSYKDRYDRVFVVLSYDQGYENEIRTYFDGYERLDRQTFSSGLEILVYKLRYE